MISSGWHTVDGEHLRTLPKMQAFKFITEMFNYGGRLSYDGLKHWQQWIRDNISK